MWRQQTACYQLASQWHHSTTSQKSKLLIFNSAMREMAAQKTTPWSPSLKKAIHDTPSRGYTITSTSSIVLCLCSMQMMSQDFGPHCCANPMRWQSVESRVEVSWIDPIALVLHWYQYLDWYAYFYGLPQWNDFDKGKHTSWRHYWHIVTNCHTVVLMYYFIIIKQIAFVFW